MPGPPCSGPAVPTPRCQVILISRTGADVVTTKCLRCHSQPVPPGQHIARRRRIDWVCHDVVRELSGTDNVYLKEENLRPSTDLADMKTEDNQSLHPPRRIHSELDACSTS
ncbi:hypothetical protein ACP70R_040268 [Stipagrostis hirtigluma subsp. patula]